MGLTILGGFLIFLIFMLKSNRITKLNWGKCYLKLIYIVVKESLGSLVIA